MKSINWLDAAKHKLRTDLKHAGAKEKDEEINKTVDQVLADLRKTLPAKPTLQLAVIATAFEDFDLNTVEGARALVQTGTVFGASATAVFAMLGADTAVPLNRAATDAAFSLSETEQRAPKTWFIAGLNLRASPHSRLSTENDGRVSAVLPVHVISNSPSKGPICVFNWCSMPCLSPSVTKPPIVMVVFMFAPSGNYDAS